MTLDPMLASALRLAGGNLDYAATLLCRPLSDVLNALTAAGLEAAMQEVAVDVAADAKAARQKTSEAMADNQEAILASLASIGTATGETAGDKLRDAQASQREQWSAKPADPPEPPPAPTEAVQRQYLADGSPVPPEGYLPLTHPDQRFWVPVPGSESRLNHMSTTDPNPRLGEPLGNQPAHGFGHLAGADLPWFVRHAEQAVAAMEPYRAMEARQRAARKRAPVPN